MRLSSPHGLGTLFYRISLAGASMQAQTLTFRSARSLPRSCKDGEVKEKREVALLPGDPVDERDKALSSAGSQGKASEIRASQFQ